MYAPQDNQNESFSTDAPIAQSPQRGRSGGILGHPPSLLSEFVSFFIFIYLMIVARYQSYHRLRHHITGCVVNDFACTNQTYCWI